MYIKDEAAIKLEREIEELCKQDNVQAVSELIDQVNIPGLYLDGLTSLSLEMAQVLASRKNKYVKPGEAIHCTDAFMPLSLNGLTTISPEVAQALANFKEGTVLGLNGLTTISPEVAQALASFKRFEGEPDGIAIFLQGLTSMSPEVVKELALFKGQIFVNKNNPDIQTAIKKSGVDIFIGDQKRAQLD